MNILEVIIIALASALEIASIVLCKGAVFSKISREKIGKLIVIFSSWQVITLLAGNFFAYLFLRKDVSDMQSWFLKGVVVVIFFALAIEMIIKSFRNNFVEEVRNDKLQWSEAWNIANLTGFTSLLAGFGFGLLATKMIIQVPVFAVSSVIAVISGLFVGYRFGYHPKRKAYFFSGTLLIAIDIELFCRIFHLIRF